MIAKNNELRDKIIKLHGEGNNPRQISEMLQAEGIKRPSDNKTLTRKDINNRLMGLRNSGVLPPLKKSQKITENNINSQKGAAMSDVTVDQVKESLGITQAKLAKKMKVNPGSLVRWKKEGIPERYIPRFQKLLGNASGTVSPEISNTAPKKRKYTKRKTVTPVLKEVTPEEIGVTASENTIFVVTKDKAVINELISRFV